jgi:hypothetical protein
MESYLVICAITKAKKGIAKISILLMIYTLNTLIIGKRGISGGFGGFTPIFGAVVLN